MKKLFFLFNKPNTVILFLLYMMTIGLISVSAAEPGVAINIRVTISVDEIILGPVPFSSYVEMLKIPLDSQNISSNHLGIKNIGFSPFRISLSVQDVSTTEVTDTPWVYSETDFTEPLLDYHFRLAGIFTDQTRLISLSDFSNDDILLRAGRVCSEQAHAFDSENKKHKGFDIGPDQWRTMYFRLDIPMQGTDGELAVKINVTAGL